MAAPSCSAAHEALERFLHSARDPVLIEPGMDPIPLSMGSYELRFDGSRLSIQAWTTDRNVYRLITAVESESAGRLDVTIHRFGGRSGTLQFLDKARSATERLTRRASRVTYREVFRRFLSRQFPGWKIAELSSAADLQHSLSPAYTRALIRRGATALAALGAPESMDADGALTYGLIWLDYLRRRDPRANVQGLVLLLPERHERTTCHRIRHLDQRKSSFLVYVQTGEWEQVIDIQDAGNIQTSLVPRDERLWLPDWLRPVQEIEGVETVECGLNVSLRVHGLEFVRCAGSNVRFGIGGCREANDWHAGEIASLARELIRARHAGNRAHPLYAAAPERWMESIVRRNLTKMDAGLHSSPVYGQAPTFVAGERGVIDLLAAGTDGRLAVIEVKAFEDPHLPLQALEYWARVHWHQLHGEFRKCGYFSQLPLTTVPPRMFLVAPALQFHPTTETILKFFPPSVDVARIGVTAAWRSEFDIVFRAFGAERAHPRKS